MRAEVKTRTYMVWYKIKCRKREILCGPRVDLHEKMYYLVYLEQDMDHIQYRHRHGLNGLSRGSNMPLSIV